MNGVNSLLEDIDFSIKIGIFWLMGFTPKPFIIVNPFLATLE